MGFSIDTNILLYGSDETSRYHERAVRFLRGLAEGREPLYLTWPVIMGYLRIATHAAIFAKPLTPEAARSNIAALFALPRTRVISEGADFWDAYVGATEGVVARGNHVPDTHIAALLRHHDVKTLYTNDADFRRFRFLDIRNPFD